MDVTSYEYRISQVKNQHDLDIQIKKARILARSLTDQANLETSRLKKSLLIEASVNATNVQWMLSIKYFQILDSCKGKT